MIFLKSMTFFGIWNNAICVISKQLYWDRYWCRHMSSWPYSWHNIKICEQEQYTLEISIDFFSLKFFKCHLLQSLGERNSLANPGLWSNCTNYFSMPIRRKRSSPTTEDPRNKKAKVSTWYDIYTRKFFPPTLFLIVVVINKFVINIYSQSKRLWCSMDIFFIIGTLQWPTSAWKYSQL